MDTTPPPSSPEQEKVSARGSMGSANRSSSGAIVFQDIPLNDGNTDERVPPSQVEDLSRLPRWRKWSIFACSCMLQFLLNLDMASVAVTLPNIAKDLNADQVLVFTVATGYFLAQTVFQLVFSHVSHAVGRKYAYLSGVSLYTIGAIVATTSITPGQLIGARVIQGIGAAGMFTMSAIVVVEIMQPRQRAAWTAVSQAYGALGNICGPLFAGLLFKNYSWRSVFVLEIVAAGTLFVALIGLLPTWRNRTTTPLTMLRQCDWVGMLLFFLSSVTILIPINIGGTVQPWNSPVVTTCLVVGLLILVVLIYHQRYIAANPAFPRQVFTKPVTNVAFFGSLVSGMLLSMIFYNLVLFWEGVRHLPTMDIGVMLLAVTLPYTVCAALTGIAIKMWGRIKWATIAGTVFAELGLALMYFLTEHAPVGPLVVITMLAAIGCGIYLPAMINTILASTDRQWHSHAIAMRTQLYTAGQCMGISIGLAIFTNKFDQGENSHDKAAITPQGLMRMIKDLPHDSQVITNIVVALRWVWGAAALIGFVAGMPACILKCPTLPKDDSNDQNEEKEPQPGTSLSENDNGTDQGDREDEVTKRSKKEPFDRNARAPVDPLLPSGASRGGPSAKPIVLSTIDSYDEDEVWTTPDLAASPTASLDPNSHPGTPSTSSDDMAKDKPLIEEVRTILRPEGSNDDANQDMEDSDQIPAMDGAPDPGATGTQGTRPAAS